MSQAQPRQQLTPQGQMLQRQLMLKQFQELQKHQQFPQSADERQRNYLNQQSEILMSANTSVMPHGTSAAVQGLPNEYVTQPRRQDLLLTNTYNTRVQGQSPDSAVAFTKISNNQADKSAMESLYGKPFLGVNQNISRDLNSFTGGAFQSKQFTNGKNLFGQVPNEGFEQMSSIQMNAPAQGFSSRQAQRGSSEQFQGKTTNMDSSQSTTLDPLEQKFLFGVDDNDGNWSALMQSAVAESSSDDGVVQEEWSGLSFQNTEASMDKHPSHSTVVGNQQPSWVDNNVPSSLSGKPQASFSEANMRSGFPGFQFPNQQREGAHSDSSHESVQQSPKVGANWKDGSSQQAQPVKGPQHHMVQPPFGKAFPFQGFQLPSGNAEQRNKFANSGDQTSISPSFGVSSITRLQQGSHNVASATGSIYMSNQHQNMYPSASAVNTQHLPSPYMAKKQLPYDLFKPQGASQSKYSPDHVGQEFPILETVPVDSSRKSPSLRASTGPHELPSGSRLSSDPKNNKLQAPQWVTKDQHVQNVHDGSLSQNPGASSTKHLSEGNGVGKLGTGILMGHPHRENFDIPHGRDKQVPSVSVRDFEAFGRSLKPLNLHLNYPSSSAIEHESGTVSGPSSSIFSKKQSIKPSTVPLTQKTAEDVGVQSQYANGNDMAFHKTDQSQVKTQMASWLKQYGGLSRGNGQMFSIDKTVNHSLHPSPLGKTMGITEMKKATMVPLGGVKLSAPCTSHTNLGDIDLSKSRSGKRKTATSALLPWHTEVTKSSKRLESISVAEMEWTKTANRLVDKVDNEVNVTKDVDPLRRSKKRLVHTTQLMQNIFKPAPAAFLRANAALNYDSVACFSAKLALGDACHLNSRSSNGSALSGASDNMITEDPKTSEKITEKHVSTLVKDFTSRAEKLEADFLRLDKSASFSDAILEFKEVEKYSRLHRFAKYYASGQQKAAEPSASSGSTSSSLKPGTERYVTVVKAGALPEKTKCLSL